MDNIAPRIKGYNELLQGFALLRLLRGCVSVSTLVPTPQNHRFCASERYFTSDIHFPQVQHTFSFRTNSLNDGAETKKC
jgi:hypothetical protein